jgi:chloramphenicol 3-O-phosphotransferase
MSGHAIFLNGVPASGKTSVAKKLERRTGGAFTILSGDDVIRDVPYERRRAMWRELFARILDRLEERLRAENVVMDGAWTGQQVQQARRRFPDGLYVILRLEERERKRRQAKRPPLGHPWNPANHDLPGPNDLYDLVLDSTRMDVSTCTNAVLRGARTRWPQLGV